METRMILVLLVKRDFGSDTNPSKVIGIHAQVGGLQRAISNGNSVPLL